MDHQTLCDGQQDQPPSPPKTPEFTSNERAVAGPAGITPTSLARRCDHIIGLIDEFLTAPASCANTADARNEPPLPEVTAYQHWRTGHGSGR